MHKLLIIILFLPFTNFAQLGKEHLAGTWHYKSVENKIETYQQGEAGSGIREFTFDENGTVSYSRCTDMCGCLAETFYGTYSWNGKKLQLIFTELAPPFTQNKSDRETVSKRITLDVMRLSETSLQIGVFQLKN